MNQLMFLALIALAGGVARAEDTFQKPVAWTCVYRAPQEFLRLQIFTTPNGAVDGQIVSQSKGQEPQTRPIEARYELRDQVVYVYVAEMKTRVRPGRTLPTQEPERRDLFSLRYKKDRAWIARSADANGFRLNCEADQ